MTTPELSSADLRTEREQKIAAGFPMAMIGSVLIYFLYISITTFVFSFFEISSGFFGFLNSGNYIKYFFGLLVFLGAFLALRRITAYLPRQSKGFFDNPMTAKGKKALLITGSVLLAAWFLFYLFYTEFHIWGTSPENFAWRRVPALIVIPSVVCFAAWILFRLEKKQDMASFFVFFCYGIAILFTYYTLLFFVPSDIYHGIAYTESIYNAYHGVPYNIYTTGIYGHYGIFFAAAMRLFGGSSAAMFRLIALSGALSTLAAAVAIHHLVKNNILRITAIFSSVITVAVLRRANYWQLQPHRVLFPLLLVAFVAVMAKKNSYSLRRIIAGFVLCLLAIVWNTEIGLFCTAAFVLAIVVHLWQTEVWYSKKCLFSYLLLAGLTAGALIGAILAVNLYNILCGGEFILKDFFFPLFENSYMDGSLRANYPGGIQVWPFTLLLFLLLIFLALYHTRFIRKQAEQHDPLAPAYMAIAIVALLNFSYYANRAAYFNMDACCQLAMIALAIFANRYLGTWRDILKEKLSISQLSTRCLSLFSALILAVLACQIVFAPITLIERQAEGTWNTEEIPAAAAELAEIVPEDYLLIGTGASLLNLELDRKAPYCYRDLSDLYVGGEKVADRIVADAIAHGKVAFYLISNTEEELMFRVLREAELSEKGSFDLTSSGFVGGVPVFCYKLIPSA